MKPGIFVSTPDFLWISSVKPFLWLLATGTQVKVLSQDNCWQWLLQAGFIYLSGGKMVSPSTLSWPEIHCVDQDGLELTGVHLSFSAFPVLGLLNEMLVPG